MSEGEKVNRPLCLEMRDAKVEIVQSVNDAMQKRGLPCFILRGILEEVLNSVKEIERNELAAAEENYLKTLNDCHSEDKKHREND